MKRAQLSTGEAYYHCASDTVHLKSLLDAESKTEFVKILHKVAAFCSVTVVTYCVMDSHFHLLIKVPPRSVREGISDKVLLQRFRELYWEGRICYMPIKLEVLEQVLAEDGEAAREWRERLLGRMCDLPMFMKILKQRFSRWYNHMHGFVALRQHGRMMPE